MTGQNNEISGIKWEILKKLTKGPNSPSKLANILQTTNANISANLKLLEAYGYIKSQRIDKGHGSRKKNKGRILYSIQKNELQVTSINPTTVEKKDIKITPINNLLYNLLRIENQSEQQALIEFFGKKQDVIDNIQAIYLLKSKSGEINLLVFSDKLDLFRGEKSTLKLNQQTIRFWSHTIKEFNKGLTNKEEYFIKQEKEAELLYEAELGVSQKIFEVKDEQTG